MERARRGGALSSRITVRCMLPLGMLVMMDGASERAWRVRDPLGFCVVLHESCAIDTRWVLLAPCHDWTQSHQLAPTLRVKQVLRMGNAILTHDVSDVPRPTRRRHLDGSLGRARGRRRPNDATTARIAVVRIEQTG